MKSLHVGTYFNRVLKRTRNPGLVVYRIAIAGCVLLLVLFGSNLSSLATFLLFTLLLPLLGYTVYAHTDKPVNQDELCIFLFF